MQRYFIEIAYNGTRYHGWQVQPNARTIQGELNKALQTLLKEDVYLLGAGRTDAGVHAKKMWAHFDSNSEFDCEHITYRINRFVDADICVKQIVPVSADAHARFTATYREYEYWIAIGKNPFYQETSTFLPQVPDIDKMNELLPVLFEYEDFTSFSKLHTDVKTNHCKIYKAHWERRDEMLVFTIRADRFLRNMVRAIVGTLLEYAYGEINEVEFRRIIESKNRANAGKSAPATGLYLTDVGYPKDIWNG